jgi:hypothetical protein
LKRGWMQFWRHASALMALCVAVQISPVFHLRAFQDNSRVFAQGQASAAMKPAAEKKLPDDSVASQRKDELTLAGLRPGRDALGKAEHLFARPTARGDSGSSQIWRDDCRHESLSIFTDSEGTILQVTVSETTPGSKRECGAGESGISRWLTGHGLLIGDPSSRVLALYGQPGSRGPSTKGGQQLELFYYAFDWAGADVPQVMTVLCTPDSDAKPGRVVEITLAAPSL